MAGVVGFGGSDEELDGEPACGAASCATITSANSDAEGSAERHRESDHIATRKRRRRNVGAVSKPSASPTPNATFRAIRIYSSDDSWGEGPQWSPPGNPFVAADFPHVGSRVEVSFGAVPDEVRDQLDEVEALRGAVLQKLFEK